MSTISHDALQKMRMMYKIHIIETIHIAPNLGYTVRMIDTNDSTLLLDWSRHQTRPFGLPVRVLSPEALHQEAASLNKSRPHSHCAKPTTDLSLSHGNSNFMPHSADTPDSSHLYVPTDLVDVALFNHIQDFIERTPELAPFLIPDNLWKLRKNVTQDTQALCTRISQTPDKFFPSSLPLEYLEADHTAQDSPMHGSNDQRNRCGNIIIEASEALSANDFIPTLLHRKTDNIEDVSILDSDFKLMLIWHEFAHSLTSREYLADFLGSRKAKTMTHNNASLNFTSDGRALSAVLKQDDFGFYKYGWACVEAIDHTIVTPVGRIKAAPVPSLNKWAHRPSSHATGKLDAVKNIRTHLEHVVGADIRQASLLELGTAAYHITKSVQMSGMEKTILARFALAARRLHGGYASYIKQEAEPVQMQNALMFTR